MAGIATLPDGEALAGTDAAGNGACCANAATATDACRSGPDNPPVAGRVTSDAAGGITGGATTADAMAAAGMAGIQTGRPGGGAAGRSDLSRLPSRVGVAGASVAAMPADATGEDVALVTGAGVAGTDTDFVRSGVAATTSVGGAAPMVMSKGVGGATGAGGVLTATAGMV
jgi:hypothetical protein